MGMLHRQKISNKILKFSINSISQSRHMYWVITTCQVLVVVRFNHHQYAHPPKYSLINLKLLFGCRTYFGREVPYIVEGICLYCKIGAFGHLAKGISARIKDYKLTTSNMQLDGFLPQGLGFQ